MTGLGSLQWAQRTQGRLFTTGKLTMIRQEVQRQLFAQLRRFRRTEIDWVTSADLDTIPIPDTKLATETLAYAESISPQSLFFHSLRTYYWGTILARQDGHKLDAELFYTMALLHDIGLCSTHNMQDKVSCCFAVEGGRSARAIVAQHGTPEQADQVERAIVLHLNLHVPISNGIESHILPQATAVDVVGARLKDIQRDTVSRVIEKYPRLGFKDELIQMFAREYSNRPDSRIAFMHRIVNMDRLILRAPFDS